MIVKLSSSSWEAQPFPCWGGPVRPLSIPSGRRAPGHRGETPRTTEREPRGTRPLTGRREGRAAETEGTVAAGAAYGLPVKKRPRAPFTVHSQSPRLLPVTTGRFTPAGSGKHFGRAQTPTGVLGHQGENALFRRGGGVIQGRGRDGSDRGEGSRRVGDDQLGGRRSRRTSHQIITGKKRAK